MARRVEDAQPTKRRGYWYYIRRVPDEFRQVDSRPRIEQTTGIRIADDPRGITAREVVRKLDESAHAFWVNKREGRDADAVVRYEQSVKMAQSRGVNYLPAASIAEQTIDEIVRRVRIMANDAADDAKLVSAFLGGEPIPKLQVSQMLGEFDKLTAASRVGQSEGQQKRWRTPKETALNKFVEVIGGDRPMDSLVTQDASSATRSQAGGRSISLLVATHVRGSTDCG